MTHLRDSDGVIHCEGAIGGTYTLCGFSIDGENGDNFMEETRENINCQSCIATIRHCKKVKNSEMG